MQSTSNKTLTAQIKLVTAIVAWGGSFIALKLAVAEISPVAVIWMRFLIGWIILGWFARRQGDWKLTSWKEALQYLWLGFLGVVLSQWLQASGLITSEASTTAWISSTTPILMALFGCVFLKEKFGWVSLIGLLMSTIGVMLVIGKGDFGSMFDGGFGKPGDILVLISAPVWALYSIFSTAELQRHSVIKVTFYTVLFGWLLSSIDFFARAQWAEFSQLTTIGWISVLYLGVLCSALAYIFYNDGLQDLPTAQVGAFLYLEPLVATLISALLLSEQIVPATLIGGALILFGVWLVSRNSSDLAG